MTTTFKHKPAAIAAVLAAALAAAALAWTPQAHAGSSEQIVEECLRNGYVNPRAHSRGDLQRARDRMPSDVAEYTDCYDVISDALDSKRRRRGGDDSGGAAAIGTGGGGAGGGFRDDRQLSSPEEVQEQGRAHNEIESTLQGARQLPRVDGKRVEPDLDGFGLAASRNDLPLPILLALVAVGLTFAGAGALALRNRLPALRRKLGRGPTA